MAQAFVANRLLLYCLLGSVKAELLRPKGVLRSHSVAQASNFGRAILAAVPAAA